MTLRSWRSFTALAVATVLATTLSPLTTSSVAAATPSPTARPCATARTTHYSHVVWILLENEGYGVIGSPSAPYLNALSDHCGLATNDLATNHPSLPNYIALTSGSAQGIVDDNEPSAHPLNVPNIFSQLKSNWRTYAESMPRSCDRVTSGTYAARHNPAVYYTNLPTCASHDVALRSPLNLSSAFTMIVPNVCNDMHSCPVATGDAWLSKYVPQILASREYRSRSLALFITFDENTQSSTNRIPTIVVAPTVPAGLRVATPFTHYSLLRTTETLLHLPLLAGARSATSMLASFHL
ncbi:MAG: hypothetical protein HIU57_03205 [Acidobacteria bacterium]|nr:hypothetical protein [Acidobacteriota bacterium]